MKAYIGKYRRDDSRRAWVKIDDHDLWSLDHTLALIILPALEGFRKDIKSASLIENEDVPKELRMPEGYDWAKETDENWFKRWEYVLDEMIFAFRAIAEDNVFDKPDWGQRYLRMNNGLRLFGKYYRGLWN